MVRNFVLGQTVAKILYFKVTIKFKLPVDQSELFWDIVGVAIYYILVSYSHTSISSIWHKREIMKKIVMQL